MICIGTGNEGRSAGHKAGIVRENEETVIQLAVQEQEPALNLQIWKAYYDIMDISFVSPSGERIGPIQEVLGTQRFSVGNTEQAARILEKITGSGGSAEKYNTGTDTLSGKH